MARRNKRPLFVAGIIERSDNSILIARPGDADDQPRRWEFPFGPAHDNESAEGAMRRLAKDVFGLEVEIVVGQPPLIELVDGHESEIRYFFCGVSNGEAHTDRFAELRWIHKAHLREYEFDGTTASVVEWMLEPPR